jgi:2-amino-4-hydroxy-6-hydroxymethyldihydropteridine diphosphokinase
MPAPVLAYVGLGSNLSDPVGQLRSAVVALGRLPQTRVEACSSLYRSAPVGMAEQPDFVNAVCRLSTQLPSPSLMQAFLSIEQAHGRVRVSAHGGPRTLDLDLLLYGATYCNSPALRLPHPRLHLRAFVLAPLAELDPGLVIPGHGPVNELLAQCAGQRVSRLTD